jgi:hypothetical protein
MRRSARLILGPLFLAAALAAVVFVGRVFEAKAQYVPGAPTSPGTVSLQWFAPTGTNVAIYQDAGFLYPSPNGNAIGVGPTGTYFTLTDAGTIYTGSIEPGPAFEGISITVTPTAGATGTLTAQVSNDNAIWINVGTALTMDGGVGPYTFGGVGAQSQISPQPAALVRIQDLSSAGTATISATAVSR